MRMTFAVLATLCLAGCSYSMQELKARGPIESLSSSKQTQDVAQCILFAWQNQSIAGVHDAAVIQPRQGGGQTVASDSLREVADVYPLGQKTRVDFFTNGGGTNWVSDRRLAALTTCI